MDKLYQGLSKNQSGEPCVFVHSWDSNGNYERSVLTHQPYHSPDGFSWGYAGSGPADLARSMLADYLGHIPDVNVYQDFKFDVVAKFEHSWTYESHKMKKWVENWCHHNYDITRPIETTEDLPLEMVEEQG